MSANRVLKRLFCGAVVPGVLFANTCFAGSIYPAYGDAPLEKVALEFSETAKELADRAGWAGNDNKKLCYESSQQLFNLHKTVASAELAFRQDLAQTPGDPIHPYTNYLVRSMELLLGNTIAEVGKNCYVAPMPKDGSEQMKHYQAARENFQLANTSTQNCGAARNGLSSLEGQLIKQSRASSTAPIENPSFREVMIYSAAVEERCLGSRWLDRLKILHKLDPEMLNNASQRLQQRMQRLEPSQR